MRLISRFSAPQAPVLEKTDHQSSSASPQETKEAITSTASDTESEVVDSDFQHGVQSAQAINQIWTRNDLLIAYALIWIVALVQSFASGMTSTLTPYVTSSFEEHSLTATTSIISSLIAGLFKLPYAKIIDIWGRQQGFALMIASCTLGLIMMAGCNNVQTYCAAQVFYNVGYYGIDFTLTIFVADTSKLKNRALMIAYTSSPWLAITWAYGPATSSILNTIGFRWGFGIWAIVYPVASAPLFYVFYKNNKKAHEAGLVPARPDSGRTFAQSVVYYAKEFDIIGLLLLSAGLGMFLLSFSLYSYQASGWHSALTICLITFGALLIVAFALYERFLAPVTFIPWALMKNRTVFFTYTMVASLYCAYALWDSYFYSFLIVVFDVSIAQATYITNIYTIGSCFWALVIGVIIKFSGRLKTHALFFGVPITILGVALMIKFRQPDTPIGYIVMCHIFIAFGGGTLVICEQMTVMAVSKHQHIPAILAMEAMIANIGSSIGATIAAAMWTGIFPVKLARFLPASAQDELLDIYGSLDVQSGYPVGSPTRIGIDTAYGETQKLMLVAATSLYSITLVSVMLWKEVNIKDIKQVRGRVI